MTDFNTREKESFNKLKEFMSLTSRKDINEWKDKNDWIEESEFDGKESRCSDTCIVANLGYRCREIVDHEKYLDYLDEDDEQLDYMKWKTNGKKNLKTFLNSISAIN